jgi:hypothetical protein
MTRSHSSIHSHSSSKKVCPNNKFSLLSGCVSWNIVLTLISLGVLLIICLLITNSSLSRRQRPYQIKNNDIIEERRDIKGIRNGRNANIERVDEVFEPNDSYISPHDGTGTPVSDRIQYDIKIDNRDLYPEVPNRNVISYPQFQAEKSIERIINPILPPERSYVNTYGIPINIPSRGPVQTYQQVGILYKENVSNPDQQSGNNNDSNILPLFGRPTYNGSNKWNYYTSSDKFQNFKLPITRDGRKCDKDIGCDEIRDGDILEIPSYNGKFKVEIYDYDRPRYIPYVY